MQVMMLPESLNVCCYYLFLCGLMKKMPSNLNLTCYLVNDRKLNMCSLSQNQSAWTCCLIKAVEHSHKCVLHLQFLNDKKSVVLCISLGFLLELILKLGGRVILNFPNQLEKILIHINMLHLAYCFLLSGNKWSVKVAIISHTICFFIRQTEKSP